MAASTQGSTAKSVTLLNCLISGGLAGLSVDLALYPLDTIKTRLQSQQGLWKSGAFRGIYSGISPVLAVSAPNAALFFFTYEACKKLWMGQDAALSHQHPPLWVAALFSSLAAELVATTIRVPAEIIKQKRQVFQYHHTRHAVQSIYKTAGLLGFYQGFLPMIFRDLPFAAIQFTLYEQTKALLARRKRTAVASLPPAEAALCGALSGGLGAIITTPLDVIKTRTMLFQAIDHARVPSIIRIAYDIVTTEGMGKLSAGMLPRMCWITLGGFIYFGIYEKTKHTLIKYEV